MEHNYDALGRRLVVGALASCCLVHDRMDVNMSHADGITPATTSTAASTALNGVPVVDISQPNKAGLSHNKYQTFNVDNKGAVLNNATAVTRSQLAGVVKANPNLKAGQEAEVILNEVTSANRSQLQGFLEVHGKKADVIVANPYGITANGTGFINTSRAVLTTGTPQVNAAGQLSNFRVTRGDLSVEGKGINASGQEYLDLVARNTRVDASIHAKNLHITTGSNDWNYTSRESTPLAATGAEPAYAIDSTAVGGMYADKIRIIATEAGVGVRMLGDMAASAEDLVISSTGKLEMKNKASAQTNIMIDSKASSGADAISLEGASLTAGSAINLVNKSGGGVTLAGGTLVAGNKLEVQAASFTDTARGSSKSDNKRFASHAVVLSIAGDTKLNGVTYVCDKGSITATSGSLAVENDGTLLRAADTVAMTTRVGDLDLGSAAILSGSHIVLNALAGGISTKAGTGQGIQTGVGNISLQAKTTINNAGKIATKTGEVRIRSNDGTGTLSLVNSGLIQTSGALDIAGHGATPNQRIDITNQEGGNLLGNTVSLQANDIENSGTIQGLHGTKILAKSLTNNVSGILTMSAASDDGDITVENMTNAGITQSAGSLNLIVTNSLSNTNRLLATRNLFVTSPIFSMTGGVTQAGEILSIGGNLNLGVIGGRLLGLITHITSINVMNTGFIQGTGGLSLRASRRLGNSGTIIASDLDSSDGSISTKELTNSGTIQSKRDLTISATSLDNSGTVLAAGAVVVKSAAISNTDSGIVQAGSDLMLSDADNGGNMALSVTGGKLLAGTGVTIKATRVDNAGIIQGKSSLDVAVSDTLSNRGVVLASGGAPANIVAVNLIDNRGSVQSGGDMRLTSNGINDVSGRILAGGSLIVRPYNDPAYKLSFQSGAFLQAGGALDIEGAKASLTVQDSTLKVDRVSFNLAQLTNSGLIHANSGLAITASTSVTNSGTLIASEGGSDGTIVSPNVTNSGTIQSKRDLSLSASSSLGNSGTLLASGNLLARGPTISTGGRMQAGSALTLSDTSGGSSMTLSVTGGLLMAGSTVDIRATQVDNAGTIQSASTFTLSAANTLKSSGGIISTGGDVNLSAPTLIDNLGLLQSAGAMQLTSNGLNDTSASGRILAGGNLTIRPSSNQAYAVTVQSGAGMQAGGTLDIDGFGGNNPGKATLTVQNASSLKAGLLRINLAQLTNNGTIQSSSGMTFTVSGTLTNSGTLIVSDNTANDGSITANVISNTGTVQSKKDLILSSSTPLTNSGNVLATGNLKVRAPTITSSGTLQAGSALTLTDTSDAGSMNLSVTGGKVLAGTTLDIKTIKAENAGTLQSGTTLTLAASDTVTNKAAGSILSLGGSGAILSAPTLIDNQGLLQSAGAMQLTANALNDTTSTGKILAGGNLTIRPSSNQSYNVTVQTSARMQAGATLDLDGYGGSNPGKVGLSVQSGSSLLAGELKLNLAQLTNAGAMQGTNGTTLAVSGTLTNSGTLIVSDNTAKDGSVTANAVTNTGTLQSKKDLTVTATTTLDNSGTLYATGNLKARGATLTHGGSGIMQAGSALTLTDASDAGSMNLTVTGGKLLAGSTLDVKTIKLENAGTLQSGTTLTLVISDTLNNKIAGVILAQGGTGGVISATNLIDNLGVLQSAGNLSLTTLSLTDTSATPAGKILAGSNLTIRPGSDQVYTVKTGAVMQAGGSVDIDGYGGNNAGKAALTVPSGSTLLAVEQQKLNLSQLTNSGTIQGNKGVTLTASGTVTNSGTFILSDNIANDGSLTANVLTNTGTLQSKKDLTVTATTLDHSGTLYATGNLKVRGTTLGSSGTLQAGSALTLTDASDTGSMNLNVTGGKLLAGSTLDIKTIKLDNAGTLQSGTTLTLAASDTLNNKTAGVILAQGGTGGILSATNLIDNQGVLQSAGNLSLTSLSLTDTSATPAGKILAGSNLTIRPGSNQTYTVKTGAVMQAGGSVDIDGYGGNNAGKAALTVPSGSTLLAVEQQKLNLSQLTNSGTIQGNKGVTLTASGTVTNSGTFILSDNTANDGTLTANVLTNTGTLQSKKDLTVTATTLDHSGTLYATGNLKVRGTTLGSSGTLQAGSALTLTDASDTGSMNLNVTGGKLLAGSTLDIKTIKLDNAGTLQSGTTLTLAASDTLNNKTAGVILAQGGTGGILSATNLIDNQGVLQSAGDLSLTTLSLTDTSATPAGKILAGSNLTIRPGSNQAYTVKTGAVMQAGAIVDIDGYGGNNAGKAALTVPSGSTLLALDQQKLNLSQLTNSGTMQGNKGVTLTASGTVTNSGTFILSDNTANDGSLTANALTNTGTLQSKKDLLVSATTLDNSGTLYATSNLKVRGATLGSSGTVQAGAALTLYDASDGGSMNLNVTGGKLLSGTSLDIKAIKVDNAGTLQSGTTLGLTVSDTLTNKTAGVILVQSGSATSLTATNVIDNQGVLQTAGDLTLNANSITDTSATPAGKILAGGNLTLRPASDQAYTIKTGAVMQTAGILDIDGYGGNNAGKAALTVPSGGVLLAVDQQKLNLSQLTSSGTIQAANGVTLTASGTVTNNGTFILSDNTAKDGSFTANVLTNTGTLQSKKDLTVVAATLDNSGTLYATGNLKVRGATLGSSGVVQAGAALTLYDASDGGSMNLNVTGGKLLSGTSLDIKAIKVDNAGTLQSGTTLGLTVSDTLTNKTAGIILVQSGSATSITATNAIDNQGLLQAAGNLQLISNSLTDTSATPAGKILAGGNLTIRPSSDQTYTIKTGARMQAAGVLDIDGFGGSNPNKATLNVQSGGTLIADSMSLNLAQLTNSGTFQTRSLPTLSTAGSITNSGTMNLGTDNSSTVFTFASLTNSGTLQSGGALTFNSDTGGLNNSGSLLATGALQVTGKSASVYTLTNTGRIQGDSIEIDGYNDGNTVNIASSSSSSIIKATTGNMVLRGQTIGNSGGIDAAGILTLTGTSLTQTGSSSYLISGGGAGGITLTGALSNEGAIHANGNNTISATAITNAATGGISSTGGLSLTASSGNLDNQGALYGSNSINASATGTFTNGTAGTIDSGGSITLNAPTFTNNYTITAAGNVSITAADFSNVGAYTTAGPLSFTGYPSVAWNQTDFKILTAPSSPTSSLFQDLPTTYSSWPSTDTFGVSIDRSQYDSDIASLSNPRIEIGSATRTDERTVTDSNSQVTVSRWAQILSNGGTLSIGGFNSGKNWGGIFSANTVNLTGNGGGSTFSVGSVAPVTHKQQRIVSIKTVYVHNYTPSSDPSPCDGTFGGSGNCPLRMSYAYSYQNFTLDLTGGGSGGPSTINASTLNASGFALSITGSPSSGSITSRSKSGTTTSSLSSGTSASSLNSSVSGTSLLTGTGTASGTSAVTGTNAASGLSTVSGTSAASGTNAVSGLSTVSGTSATTGANAAQGLNAFSGTNAASGTSSASGLSALSNANATSNMGLSASLGTLSGGGAASGVGFASGTGNVSGVSATSGTSPVTRSLLLPGANTVDIDGFSLNMPTNPNGLYVAAKNPNASYLVESNPRFLDPSKLVGSDYLLKSITNIQDANTRRLGDAAYETQMIRQQMLSQTRSNKLSGYQNEQSMIRSMYDNAANQSRVQGLTLGRPLTQSQMSTLTQDIVWMVEVEVNGQKALAPRVYLAPSTIANLTGKSTTTISAENVNMDLTSLSMDGGTLEGTKNLNVTSKGDISNSQGTMQGGNVKLASTEGSIRNRGGTIQSDENLSLTANWDVSNSAGGTIQGENVSITATKGSISNSGGSTISADESLDLTAKNNISNDGGTISGSDVDLTATDGSILNANGGTITGDSLDLQAKQDIINSGGTIRGDQVTLTAQEGGITNQNGGTLEGDDLSLQAQEDITNIGATITGQRVELASSEGGLSNLGGGKIEGKESLGVDVKGDITNAHTGSTITGGTVSLNSSEGSLNNSGGAKIEGKILVAQVQKDINNAGGTITGQSVSLNAREGGLNNSGGGTIEGKGSLAVQTKGNINNDNATITGGTVSLNSWEGGLNNSNNGKIQAGTLIAQVKGDINNIGATISGKSVSLTSSEGSLNNTGNGSGTGGKIEGTGTLSVQTKGNINNTGSTITGGEVSLTSKEGGLNNSGGGKIEGTVLVANVKGDINNAGSTITGSKVALTSTDGGLNNTGEGIIQGTGSLMVNTKGDINNTGSSITGGTVVLTSTEGGLNNSDKGVIEAKDILAAKVQNDINNAGSTIQGGKVALQSTKGGLNNTDGGTIKGSDTLAVVTKQDIVNKGSTITGGEVALVSTEGDIRNISTTKTETSSTTLNYQDGNNKNVSTTVKVSETKLDQEATISSTKGNLTLSAETGSIINQGGKIDSAGDASLKAVNIYSSALDLGKTSSVDSVTTDKSGKQVGTSNFGLEDKTHQGSSITAKGNLDASALGNVTLVGTKTAAGGNLDIHAGGNLTVAAVQDAKSFSASGTGVNAAKNKEDAAKNNSVTVSTASQGAKSTLSSGGNLSLDSSGGSTTIQATKVTSGGNTKVNTGGDFILSADGKQKVEIASEGGLAVTSGGKAELANSTVTSKDSMSITAKNDISIAGGKLSGYNVALESKEGSITQKSTTKSQDVTADIKKASGNNTNAKDTFTNTWVDEQSSITATKNLSLTANKDIINTGADMTAGGNATLTATTGKVTFDTIKTTNNTAKSSSSDGGTFGVSSSSSTVTTETKNVASNLKAGGTLTVNAQKDITLTGTNLKGGSGVNLGSTEGSVTIASVQDYKKVTDKTETSSLFSSSSSTKTLETNTTVKSNVEAGSGGLNIKSGKDTTLQAVDVTSKGGLSIDAGGKASITDMHDTASMKSSGSSSGLGQGGALWASESTTEDSDKKVSVGSEIKVAGNTTIKAGTTLTIQGSKLNTQGDTTLDATDVKILAGKNEESSTKTRTTMELFSSGNSSASAGTMAKANATGGASSTGASGKVSAEVGAQANAKQDVNLFSTTTTKTDRDIVNYNGSELVSGGNLTIKAQNTVRTESAKVQSGGNMDISAKNIEDVAMKNVDTTKTTSSTQTVGMFSDNQASAGASAKASGSTGAGVTGGSASAQAGGSASTNNTIGFRNQETETLNVSEKHAKSSFVSGGNMTMTAQEKITMSGTNVKVGGNLTQTAQTIENKAVYDREYTKTKSETHVGGMYLDGGADAKAEANLSGGAGAGVNAKAEIQGNSEVGQGVGYGHTGTNYTSERNTAQTTQYSVGGNMVRTATNKISDEGTKIDVGKNFEEKAKVIESKAAYDTFSESFDKNSESFKMGGYAGANANAQAGTGSGANASAGAGVGARVGVEGVVASSSSSSKTAVVSSIKAGGTLSSTATESASFEGTSLTGKGVMIDAATLEFKEARNTTTSTSNSDEFSVGLKGNVGVSANTALTAGGALNVGFKDSSMKSSTDKAVVGKIQSSDGLVIKTQGDATFVGTQMDVKGDTEVSSETGNITFAEARDRSSSNTRSIDLQLGAAAGDVFGRDSGAAVAGNEAPDGFDKSQSNVSSSVGGSSATMTLSDKNKTTSMDSSSITGKGMNVALNLGVNVGVTNKSSDTAVAASLKSSGNIQIKSGNNLTLVGTKIQGGGNTNIEAKNKVDIQAAKNNNSSSSVDVGLQLGGSVKGGVDSLGANLGVDVSNSSTNTVSTISGNNVLIKSSDSSVNMQGTKVTSQGQTTLQSKEGVNFSEVKDKNTSVGVNVGFSMDSHKDKNKDGTGEKTTTAGGYGTANVDKGSSTQSVQIVSGGGVKVLSSDGSTDQKGTTAAQKQTVSTPATKAASSSSVVAAPSDISGKAKTASPVSAADTQQTVSSSSVVETSSERGSKDKKATPIAQNQTVTTAAQQQSRTTMTNTLAQALREGKTPEQAKAQAVDAVMKEMNISREAAATLVTQWMQ